MKSSTMFVGAEQSLPDGEKRWKAESDLRTLLEARRIRETPDRLTAALKIAREQKEELGDLTE